MFRLVCLILLVSVLPAAAQTPAAVDLIPADFAGFIRLDMADPNASANDANVMLALAGQLQPARVRLENALDFDTLIPFASLFDVDNVSFAASVLPWLDGEIVLAYRQFDAALAVSPDDVLLLLPTRDLFLSASRLKTVIEGPASLEPETYRDVILYAGDRVTLALTPAVVLVGADDLVRQALDVQAGAAAALTASAAYRAAWGQPPANTLISAYVTGAYLPQAVTGLISGSADAAPLWAALGEAITTQRGTPELAALLVGGYDGAGVHLGFDTAARQLVAAVTLHAADRLPLAASREFDPALLDYLPRAAFWVQRGGSLNDLISTALAALPFSSFAGQMLGGLPLATVGVNPILPAPTAGDVQAAVAGFFDGLQTGAAFDARAAVFDRLTGSYVLALLPRPNDPLPALRLPVDVLLVTPATDADALVDNISRLLRLLFNLTPANHPDPDSPFTLLTSGTDVIFEIGVADGVLIVGTGDAADRALAARRGDSRLTDQPGWTWLQQPDAPGLYVDTAVFFNTFFPSPGGSTPGLNQRIRVGVWSAPRPPRLWELKLVVTLPMQ